MLMQKVLEFFSIVCPDNIDLREQQCYLILTHELISITSCCLLLGFILYVVQCLLANSVNPLNPTSDQDRISP